MSKGEFLDDQEVLVLGSLPSLDIMSAMNTRPFLPFIVPEACFGKCRYSNLQLLFKKDMYTYLYVLMMQAADVQSSVHESVSYDMHGNGNEPSEGDTPTSPDTDSVGSSPKSNRYGW